MALSPPRTPQPLRAILGVHLATHWIAMFRQSGRAGAWSRVLFGGTMMLGYAVFMIGGMGLCGWHLDTLLTRGGRGTVSLAAGLLAFYVMTFGFTAALEGGARRLPWETLRVFPVSTRTLFLAELGASAIDGSSVISMLGVLSFCTTASVAQPRATPAFALLFTTHALLLLTVPLVIGGILQRLSRKLRLMLMLMPLVALAVAGLGTVQLATCVTRERLRELLSQAGQITLLTPGRALLAWVAAIARDEPAPSSLLGAAAVPIALTLAAMLAAYWLIARESPSVPRDEGGRLWTFSRPVWGVARLQWTMLMSSMPGRFALAFPLLGMLVSRGLSESRASIVGVAFAFLYSGFGLIGLVSNMFGLDRHGIKALLLLPIDERTLLRGKVLGHLLLAAAQALVLVALFAVFRAAPASEVATGVVAHACMFVLLCLVGMPFSVWAARPVRASGVRTGAALRVLLVLFGTVPTCALLVGGILLTTAYWLPGWEPAAMLALLAALIASFELLLRFSARYLVRHRERLVEQLGGAA